MAANDDTRIISHDWTDLFRHRSRQFTMDQYSLGPGVDFVGAGWALGAFALTGGGLTWFLRKVDFPWWWVGLVIGVVVAVIAYTLLSKDTGGKVTPLEGAALWLDYWLFQPAMLQGEGADDYPTDLHWQVLFFRPEDMPPHHDAFPPAVPYGTRRK
ncbi:hypothetical protein [Rhodococcus sp. NPDC060176]|uniref:hypothetical protein n=1 Tax=Rhodococcus sp. NPDC060176 TaxID=3347062 RepID=UPI00364D3752